MRIWQNTDIARAWLDYVGANREGLCALEEQIMFCSTAAEQSLKKAFVPGQDKCHKSRGFSLLC